LALAAAAAGSVAGSSGLAFGFGFLAASSLARLAAFSLLIGASGDGAPPLTSATTLSAAALSAAA